MKRIFVALSALIVIFTLFYLNGKPTLSGFNKQIETYLNANGSNADIITINEREFAFYRAVTGECVKITDLKLTVNQIFERFGATAVFIEELEHGVSYYGYSDKIPYRKIVDSKAINIQVFVSNSETIIGCPLIYGSF